jgi:hypothetical protein
MPGIARDESQVVEALEGIRNVVAVLSKLPSWNKQGAPLRTKEQVCQWLNSGSRKFYVACYCTENFNSRFIKNSTLAGTTLAEETEQRRYGNAITGRRNIETISGSRQSN